MTADSSLIIDVIELRRRTGSRRVLETDLHLDDLHVGESSLVRSIVDGHIHVDLIVEAVTEGVIVSGFVSGVGRVPCRRCLDPVDEAFGVELREIFNDDPTEGETWPIEAERIDATPAVREASLLCLPLVPLCRDDCEGPVPERFPTRRVSDVPPKRDARWAALDELTFDD